MWVPQSWISNSSFLECAGVHVYFGLDLWKMFYVCWCGNPGYPCFLEPWNRSPATCRTNVLTDVPLSPFWLKSSNSERQDQGLRVAIIFMSSFVTVILSPGFTSDRTMQHFELWNFQGESPACVGCMCVYVSAHTHTRLNSTGNLTQSQNQELSLYWFQWISANI